MRTTTTCIRQHTSAYTCPSTGFSNSAHHQASSSELKRLCGRVRRREREGERGKEREGRREREGERGGTRGKEEIEREEAEKGA